jgi:hypothetical protein
MSTERSTLASGAAERIGGVLNNLPIAKFHRPYNQMDCQIAQSWA